MYTSKLGEANGMQMQGGWRGSHPGGGDEIPLLPVSGRRAQAGPTAPAARRHEATVDPPVPRIIIRRARTAPAVQTGQLVGATATGTAMPAGHGWRVFIPKKSKWSVWLSHWPSFLFLFGKKWPSWDREDNIVWMASRAATARGYIIVYVPD